MKKNPLLLLASIWLAAVSTGTGVLLVYDHNPGQATAVPCDWPVHSSILHAPGRPTLVMFAHPKCPCTRASIGELAVLLAQCQNQVTANVVFFQPKGSAADWPHTDLWRSAEAIQGVKTQADEDGQEARRFQVMTSGHVVLYDAHGQWLFSGGITSARGHAGDNAGRDAIRQQLDHALAAGTAGPVFGCPLLNPTPACRARDTTCAR